MDIAVYDPAQSAYAGGFEAMMYEYGMEEGVVDISAGQLSGEKFDIVEDYRNQMRSGELDVFETVFE